MALMVISLGVGLARSLTGVFSGGQELAALGYEGEDGGGSGLAKVRERLGLGGGTEEWEAAAEEGGDMGEAEADGQAESRDEVMKALEEYYKLDYEQDIGGLKCRFKYRCASSDHLIRSQAHLSPICLTVRSVDAEDFGMKPDEVLGMPDKDLNDLVGLRVLAPYREDTWRHKKLRYKVRTWRS